MLPLLVSIRFQVLFHSPNRGSFQLSLTVLVHYRWQNVFSLSRWSCRIPTRFLVSRGTWESYQESYTFRLQGFHLLWPAFPGRSARYRFCNSCADLAVSARKIPLHQCRNACTLSHETGLGSSRFARRYSGNHYCFLFLRVLRCFSSPGARPFYGRPDITLVRLPHSDISGSKLACSSPKRFAANRVLRRHSAPRHPPYALCSLTN